MSESLLRMPRLGETMEEGEIAAWLVEPGQAFARGDALIEVETDKTMVEYPALGAGTLIESLVAAGERVAVGEPIARVDVGDGPDWTAADDGEARPDGSAGERANGPDAARGDGASVDGVSAHDTSADSASARDASADDTGATGSRASPDATSGAPRRATPVARRLAREAGLALENVSGSGRCGRIEREDVERALAKAGARTAARAGTVGAGSDPDALPVRHAREIAYVVAGPDGGTPFALLHGFAGDRTTFAATTSALARAGCRVAAFDLPGHGATRLEASRPDALSHGLADALDAALGGGPVHLVAHSLGAVAALDLAREVSLASLTLVAPAGIGHRIDAGFVRAMAEPASVGEVAHLLRRLSERPGTLGGAAIEALYRELARGRLRGLAGAMLGTDGQAIDIVPALERVARELLVRVLVGHRDRIVDWRDACALSPAIGVHHFPRAGHMPHWDEPRDVAALLERIGRGTDGNRTAPRARRDDRWHSNDDGG